MINIYTTPSCSSCRKAKQWFKNQGIEYKEKNFFNIKLTRNDIQSIIVNSENGFDDIISKRSKIIKESNIDIDSMSTNQLTDYIIENPSVLRRPIIIDDRVLQVGYNQDEIRVFIPKELRAMDICSCRNPDNCCEYVKSLKKSMQLD